MLSPDVAKKIKDCRMQFLFNKNAAAFYIPYSCMPFSEDASVGRLATDGRQIIVSPEFIIDTPPEKLRGGILHEYLHNVLGHTSKDKIKVTHEKVLTKAQEIAVNNIVLQCGLELPENVIIDTNYTGWSTLAIYHDLVDKGETNETVEPGCGCVLHVILSDVPEDELMPEPDRLENIQILSQIFSNLQNIGNNSLLQTIGTLIEDVAVPIIDWADELSDTFVRGFAGDTLDLANPVAQYLPDIYIPRRKDDKIENVFIALDLSSSLTTKELGKAQKVINDLKDLFDIEDTIVITYNHIIIKRILYPQSEQINIGSLEGFGGTRTDCVFEYIQENGENPKVLLIITDTEDVIRTTAEQVPYPVIWLNTSKNRPFEHGLAPNFGKIISI